MGFRKYHMGTQPDLPEIRGLRVGDRVFITGELLTMRDMAHARALKLLGSGATLPFTLEGRVIYHCGPLVKGNRVISAGPTTSMRMERTEPELLRRCHIRGIVGKGGMGEGTKSALVEVGAVYMEYPGGAGALAAKAMRGVRGVYWRDLGDPEAVWAIAVENFGPCFVTMDSAGGTLRPQKEKK